MAEAQQAWTEEQAKAQETKEPEAQAQSKTDEPRPASQPLQPPQQVAQMPQQMQHQMQQHLQQQVSPLHLHLQSLQGHPALSPADIAALQQQHSVLLMQAQQAQQDYESEQREKGAAMQMAPPEAMGLHGLGQPAMEAPQLQHQNDADYERERKEKRKVANREAARRMRLRRAAQVSTLSVSNTDLKTENTTLQQQLAHLAEHNRELMTEVAALRQEVLGLKQTLDSVRGVAQRANGNPQLQSPGHEEIPVPEVGHGAGPAEVKADDAVGVHGEQ